MKISTKELIVTRCPVPTATSLALDLGILNKELQKSNYQATELTNIENADLHRAHFNHVLPFLVREGGNIPALWARSAGEKTKLIGLSWVDEYQAVITLSGSALDHPLALRGRKIGIPRHRYLEIDFRAAQALRGVSNALSLARLTFDDVTLVDLEATNVERKDSWNREIEALQNGEVDAVFVKGATGLQVVRELGLQEIVELGFHPDPLVRVNNGIPRTLTIDAALAKEKEILHHLLDSLTQAAEWAESKPEDFIRVITLETGADSQYVKEAYRIRKLGPTLEKEFLHALASQAEFLYKQGILPKPVDIFDWADFLPLNNLLTKGETKL
ncbi:ABC transporter substrate-binding protein [Peribacillus frigoritolerans]|uniref:ABC transporter substrate-binding protein n=1 Tax=Peribacillus frigoritolerans TaxID=450367 RepID=UPI003803DE31